MSQRARRADKTRTPTRISAAIFAAKAAVLRVRRACTGLGSGIHRHPHADPADFPIVLAESHTPLWPEEQLEERPHQPADSAATT